jgi:hypothetical protein
LELAIDVPVVAPRQPCPCGSGRRYKACHGSSRADRMITTRPFAGRVDEPEWVALREVVPAATAPLTLLDPAYAGRSVVLATVLPMAWPGMVRSDGTVFVALQTPGRSGDVARDLGQVLMRGLESEPGKALQSLDRDADSPRIQDLIDPAPLDVTVQTTFDYWVAGIDDPTGQVASALESATASIVPTERLQSVAAAYWCRMKTRCHLRWAMPHEEDPLLDAMARLAAARSLDLGEGTKYVGAFRAHGLLLPVWDLPAEMSAADVEAPAAALQGRLDELLAAPTPLSDEERRARSGLLSRQVTLR